MDTHDKALWRSIAAARYDFGAVGAALFSLFGLIASIAASAHVVASLYTASYEALLYGVALFLLAEGVAYYIEVYALFEKRLPWWLWLLRGLGPLLSAAAGGLAAYSWLPEAFRGFAVVTTIVVPLFQWGFLRLLMDRIRAVHMRRMAAERQEAPIAPEAQLLTMYRAIQLQRSMDDLRRLEAMITYDSQLAPALAAPRTAAYPAPVAVDAPASQQKATQPHTTDGTQQEATEPAVSQQDAMHCPACGAALESHGKLLAARRWGHCKACKG